jgi:hypothetical protein
MKKIITILFILISYSIFAQKDTTCFFGVNGKICSPDQFSNKVEVIYSGDKITIKTYTLSDDKLKLANTEEYKEMGDNLYQIKYKGTDSKGMITRKFFPESDTSYRFTDLVNDKIAKTGYSRTKFPLILNGIVTEYYENGNKLSESKYNNNELVSNKNWKEDGTGTIDNVFYSVDATPRFLTGIDYMNKHIIKAFKNNEIDISKLTGKLVVGFVVTKDGFIEDTRVVKSLNQKLDQIVLSAFNTLVGEWAPATLDGKPVNYFQLFPINFLYKENKLENLEFDGTSINWQ